MPAVHRRVHRRPQQAVRGPPKRNLQAVRPLQQRLPRLRQHNRLLRDRRPGQPLTDRLEQPAATGHPQRLQNLRRRLIVNSHDRPAPLPPLHQPGLLR